MAKRERNTRHLYSVQKAVLNHTSTLGWFIPKRTVKGIMNDPQAEGDSHMSTQSNTIGTMDSRCGQGEVIDLENHKYFCGFRRVNTTTCCRTIAYHVRLDQRGAASKRREMGLISTAVDNVRQALPKRRILINAQ